VIYQAELLSPEHEALRQSILQEALSAIHLIKIPGDASYLQLNGITDFLEQEKMMKACLQGDVRNQVALGRAWDTISKKLLPVGLTIRRQEMDYTFDHVESVPPEARRHINWERQAVLLRHLLKGSPRACMADSDCDSD
jgi:hypothetical protein